MKKISTNLTIKLYHSEVCSEAQIQANANELSRVLSPLGGPWAITRTGPHEIAVFCNTTAADAIVIPTLPAVSDIRFQHARSSVYLSSAMIVWQ